MPTFHPKSDEHGGPVLIKQPSTPTSASTWTNAEAMATWIPGSIVPDILNGIRVEPWTDAPSTDEGWRNVAGQADIDEVPLATKPGTKSASGCIMVEPDGRLWVVSPTNSFGGYTATFPKGTADLGLSLQVNAIKETFEESGLRVQIISLLGDFTRTTSVSRYYLARRVGGSPADMGWEAQGVRLVPQALLPKILTHPADASVIRALEARPVPPVGRKDILQSYTLDSAARIVATIADFRTRFDTWPIRILMDAGMAEAIRAHVLTPLGWSLLEGKLHLSPTAEGTVIAQGEDGKSFEYQGNRGYRAEVERWVWGCDLSE